MSSSDTLSSPLHSLLTHPHLSASKHHHHSHSHRRHRGSVDHFDHHVLGQIERSLEEGQETGQLTLSAQQIKAYPAQLAVNYDLSDVVGVDLSKNRLTDIDVAICNFYCLQSLNLYHNLVKSIPQELTNLQFLQTLNLSRNQLVHVPITVCQLSRLRVSFASMCERLLNLQVIAM